MNKYGVCFSIFLVGCTSLQPKLTELSVGEKERTFVYSEKLNASERLKVLGDAFIAANKLKGVYAIQNGEYSKVEPSILSNVYKIAYSHGVRLDSGRYAVSSTTFEMPLKITEENGKETIKLKAPVRSIEDSSLGWLGIPVSQYASSEEMKQNTIRMFNEFELKDIERNYGETIEIDSAYPEKSIMANFSRLPLCSVGSNGKGINCTISGAHSEIDIFPYKNGSKVVARLSASYKLMSNGESTRSEAVSIVNESKAKLKDIVNE